MQEPLFQSSLKDTFNGKIKKTNGVNNLVMKMKKIATTIQLKWIQHQLNQLKMWFPIDQIPKWNNQNYAILYRKCKYIS